MSKSDSFIRVEASGWNAEYDLFSSEYLGVLGITRSDVKNYHIHGAIPAHLYIEPGVARADTHTVHPFFIYGNNFNKNLR